MTDKEIIIDGVNVAGCDFLAKEDFYSSYSGEYTAYKGQCGCSDEEMCKDHPKCFYKKALKQLQRTQQHYNQIVEQNKNLQQELQNAKEEYEELKKEKELYVTWYRAKHDDWADVFFKTIKSRDYYKQALKKIEEECEHYKNAPFHFEAIYAKSSMDEIIDILNEVKDAD